jgi:hypothetical protein
MFDVQWAGNEVVPVFQAMPLLTELGPVRGGFTIHMALLTELSPTPHPYSTENSEEPHYLL